MTEPHQDDRIDPPVDQPIDPKLARLYHEHARAEPSAAVDLRILTAARQAATPRPQRARRSGWWPRWRMPLTLLTTVMLTVTLALLVERQPGELAAIQGSETSRTESAQKRTDATAAKQMETAAPARQLQAPAAPAVRAGKPAPMSSKEADRLQESNIADQKAAEPQPGGKAESITASGTVGEAVARSEMRAAQGTAAPAPAAAPLARSRTDSARPPAAWLEEIRALRTSGKAAEAEQQLREFRLRYPDYPLPEEFRQ